jgi:hypothetical protein
MTQTIIARATLREDQAGFGKIFRKDEEMKTADRFESEGKAETTQVSNENEFIRLVLGQNGTAVSNLGGMVAASKAT